MKAKAYSYIRFSTKDQIQGDSLRRQTEATAEWCKHNTVQLVENYSDLGISAFRGKNAEIGALSTFLKLASAGRIEKGSFLVVESLDRLSRNSIMDAFDLFRAIMKAGVRIVTLSDGHVYDQEKINNGNFTDLIISLTYLSRANEESRIKSQRIGAAWQNKRAQVANEKLTRLCVAWLRLADDRKSFELIPERVKIVRRIFELAAKGVGANAIATMLRKEKVKTFRGGFTWHVSYVRRILETRAAIGELTPTTRRNGVATKLEPIPNYYPAVISKELFATVAQLRKARPDLRGRSRRCNVFSKLIFDTKGNTVVYINKTGRNSKNRHEYLVSYGALVGRAEYVTWRYDDFKASFLAVCQRAALTKSPAPDRDGGELAVARLELADSEKQIGRLVDYLAKGASGSVETRLRELEDKKRELQRRIADLENEVAAKPTDVARIDWKDTEALRDNLRATVKRITMDAKARWFKAEFLDGRVYEFQEQGDKVRITTPDAPETWLPRKA
ncbi:MAG TPA: recombinase family protein [Candidatus Paceibacterota bacterium]|nr:recombinase family protein [Verrucomicrobiota bacterium]HSA12230.1 recombinase family protein [Candidatus Paceibacterota bacterium]